MKTKYAIGTLDKAPAMTKTYTPFLGTYEQAKQAAIEMWKNNPMTMPTVHAGNDTTYYYFRVASDGSFTDRNTFPYVIGKL